MLFRSRGVIGADELALSRLGALPAANPAAEEREAADRVPSDLTLPEMERQALVKALDLTEGNVTRAARELGISRDTLRYRIEKYGLETVARPAARSAR